MPNTTLTSVMKARLQSIQDKEKSTKQIYSKVCYVLIYLKAND